MALFDKISLRCDSCLRYARLGRQDRRNRTYLFTARKGIRQRQNLGLGNEHQRGCQWKDYTRVEYCKSNELQSIY